MLLIDDEPDLLELGQIGLEAAGHTVETLSDVEAVIDVIRRFQPDVIGLDWVLPTLSGEDILRRLKADAYMSSIPVVIVTALSGIDSHVRLLGADAVLHKPFTLVELASTLSEAASRRQD